MVFATKKPESDGKLKCDCGEEHDPNYSRQPPNRLGGWERRRDSDVNKELGTSRLVDGRVGLDLVSRELG
jgi:hypothetical protein